MKIYSQDVKDIGIWISFILFLFALGYIGSGSENLLIFLYAIIWGVGAIIGLFQSTSKFLKEYYCEKRRKREYENHYSKITNSPKD